MLVVLFHLREGVKKKEKEQRKTTPI
jgi:hypothetical protein